MAYNTTDSLHKLNCSDNADIGNCQDRSERLSWSKKDFNCVNLKQIVFKEDDGKEFQLVRSLAIQESDFKQFLRLRNQLAFAAENIGREENSSLVVIPTTSKDMDEQLKLSHKVVDIVDRANRKTCVTLLQ